MAGEVVTVLGIAMPADVARHLALVDDDGADASPPAPAPLVAGAIGRGLVDAAAAYSRHLASALLPGVDDLPPGVDLGPWDD